MNNINISFEYSITSNEYIEIMNSVGCKNYSKKQVTKALDNTMYVIKALVNGELAGMGRVVGDTSLVCMLCDVCVKPEFQHKGIGVMIVNNLKAKILNGVSKNEQMQIGLTSIAGYENFYKKAGFNFNPDKITGMYLLVDKGE